MKSGFPVNVVYNQGGASASADRSFAARAMAGQKVQEYFVHLQRLCKANGFVLDVSVDFRWADGDPPYGLPAMISHNESLDRPTKPRFTR